MILWRRESKGKVKCDCCILLYSVELCYIVLYDVVFCCILQRQTWHSVVMVLLREMRNVTVVYCYIVLYDVILCCMMLFCVVWCYIVLYNVICCCILQRQTWRSVVMVLWREMRSVTVGTGGTARTPVVIPATSPGTTAPPVRWRSTPQPTVNMSAGKTTVNMSPVVIPGLIASPLTRTHSSAQWRLWITWRCSVGKDCNLSSLFKLYLSFKFYMKYHSKLTIHIYFPLRAMIYFN